MVRPRSLFSRLHLRPLNLATLAVLGVLFLVCVQMALLQVRLVEAQGALDVCQGCTYESIQEAVDAAHPGDTIRVAQGVYPENLVITKSLTLLGGYESTGWTRDIELYETTIDGNRSGSVISVTNGCSTTIDGFTITRGHSQWGGGICVEGATAIVTNNRLWDNLAAPASPQFKMDGPVVDGDTVITGVGDPSDPAYVNVRDMASGAWIGSDEIQSDGRFTVTVSAPLVAGHTILALHAQCQHDEAVVQAGVGSVPTADIGADAGAGEHRDGTPYSWAVDSRVSLLETVGELEPARLAGSLTDDQDGSSWVGGGIYLIDSAAIITGNELISNTALHFGGGIYAESSSVTVEANQILDNRSGATFPCSWDYGYGGGVAIVGGSQFTLAANHIAENTILRGGGGLYVTDSVGSVVENEIVANSSYYDSAIAYGGGIYVQGCSPRIEGNDILSNMLGTEDFPAWECAYGAGVYLLGSSSLVTDNDILGNAVVVRLTGYEAGQGGGMHIQQAPIYGHPDACLGTSGFQESGVESWPVVSNNRLIGNSARRGLVEPPPFGGAGAGGAVSVWGSSVSLLENEIVGNWTGFWAGGVSILSWGYTDEESTAIVRGNQIIDNRSSAGEQLGGYGGLLVGATTATIESNLIAGNEGLLAGGLYVAGTRAKVQDNDIAVNKSPGAGGLVAGDHLTEIYIGGNRVVGNEGLIGGIDLMEGAFVVTGNQVMSNTGEIAGGIATEPYRGVSVFMDANEVVANNSSGTAGGILISPDTIFTLTNNIIADNGAEELGGGICISDSQGNLVNNTIAQNEEGAGEGIYLDGTAQATILNNIIVSHTYGIYNAGSGSSDVTYNDVWGNSIGDYYGMTPGVGNISADPVFVDPPNWDYHLCAHSPAVNAGHPDEAVAPPLDIDGDPRPFGGRVDMGADESSFDLRISKTVGPDSALPGGPVTYTIRLSNEGTESLSGLVVTDRVPVNASFSWVLDEGWLTGDDVRWQGVTVGSGEDIELRWGATVTDNLLVDEVVNESYGVLSSELPEAVMGEAVRTPLWRREWWYPLAMKNGLQ